MKTGRGCLGGALVFSGGKETVVGGSRSRRDVDINGTDETLCFRRQDRIEPYTLHPTRQ